MCPACKTIFEVVVVGEVFLYDLLLCKRTDNYRGAWGLAQWHHGWADQCSVSVSLRSGVKFKKRIIEASND